MKTDFTDEERKELAERLERASELRSELDEELRGIELMVEEDLDSLDEWVGNGIDVDALLAMDTESEEGEDSEEEDI